MQIRRLIASTAIAAAVSTSAMAQDGASAAQQADEPSAPAAPAVETKAKEKPFLPQTSEELLALLKDCNDDSCMSYVTGAIGGIAVYAYVAEKPSPFCTTGEVGKTDIRDAIVRTIEETPALLDQHPAISILTAFGQRWPCNNVAASDGAQMGEDGLPPFKVVDLDAVDALAASGRHGTVFGNLEAGPDRTILVFHDPNCPHCRDFRDETAALAERGWKVMVFPVATFAQESAGVGAVQIALRDRSPDVAKAIYDHTDGAKTMDIAAATQIAKDAGLSETEILTLLSQTNSYADVTANTHAFFDIGATGTPAWIIGGSLYSGQAKADLIQAAADEFEMDEEAINEAEDLDPDQPVAEESADPPSGNAAETGDAGDDDVVVIEEDAIGDEPPAAAEAQEAAETSK